MGRLPKKLYWAPQDESDQQPCHMFEVGHVSEVEILQVRLTPCEVFLFLSPGSASWNRKIVLFVYDLRRLFDTIQIDSNFIFWT